MKLFRLERKYKEFGEDIEAYVFAMSSKKALEKVREKSEDFNRTPDWQIVVEEQELGVERVMVVINAGG